MAHRWSGDRQLLSSGHIRLFLFWCWVTEYYGNCMILANDIAEEEFGYPIVILGNLEPGNWTHSAASLTPIEHFSISIISIGH